MFVQAWWELSAGALPGVPVCALWRACGLVCMRGPPALPAAHPPPASAVLHPQMGLPKENADKIIRGFTNQKAIASMQVGALGCSACCVCPACHVCSACRAYPACHVCSACGARLSLCSACRARLSLGANCLPQAAPDPTAAAPVPRSSTEPQGAGPAHAGQGAGPEGAGGQSFNINSFCSMFDGGLLWTRCWA